MKFLRIDLLTLLISLFILASCKNPDSIGLPVSTLQALQTTLIDTATIFTATVPDDSVITTNLAKAPLGYFKDPILGTTTADIAATLNLPGATTYTIPTGTITVDSAVLAMRYADGFYGDSLSTSYKINVFQLNEPVISKTYSNRKKWATGQSLGSAIFYPRPKTRFKITDIVVGAKDTLIKVTPQLRVKLRPNFFLNSFFGASSSQLTTNTVFQNYIKGLYMTIDSTRAGVGGTMLFNMAADSCNVEVYYRSVSSSGTIDTAKVLLRVGTPHAVHIHYNRATAATDVQTQLINFNTFATTTLAANPNAQYNATYSTNYVQGLGGLRTKISFPYLKNIAASQPAGVVLNRAELVVTPVVGTYVPFVPLPRLTLYRLDLAHQRQLIPDAYAGDLHYIAVGSFGGYYDNYHSSYHYVITGYIEDLLRGKLVDYGTFIAPADTIGTRAGTATIDVSATGSVAARSVVGGNKASLYKMKLNIIYNKVTQ